MGIRMDYKVEKLPDSYATDKIVYSYENDPDWAPHPHAPNAKPGKIRKETKVVEKGGWLFTFMRGHQIRCTSEEQIALLGLSTAPRLIDDTTGLQVNSQGIPLDIEEYTKGGLMDGGDSPDTAASLVARSGNKNPIDAAIDDTE